VKLGKEKVGYNDLYLAESLITSIKSPISNELNLLSIINSKNMASDYS